MKYGYNPIVGEKWRYNGPDSSTPFKISRSKIELFHRCPTCFYKDVKLGLRKPPMPGWAINSAVDSLLKKEVDFCRTEDRAHGILQKMVYQILNRLNMMISKNGKMLLLVFSIMIKNTIFYSMVE